MAGLSDEEATNLLYDWEFWARPNQLPPETDWFIWLILAGRGFGKTRAVNEQVRKWAFEGYSPIALIGQTKADVRDTIVEVGDSSILKISPPWFMPTYEPSKRRLTWPNGVQAIVYSGDEPDQLRGPQHAKAIVDELPKFMYPQQTWDNLLFGLRIGDKPQAAVATTPRPIKLIKDLVVDSRVVVTRGHTTDNRANLAPEFISYIMGKYQGTRLGRQELAGEVLDSIEGLVYDTFDVNTCVIPRFALPDSWPRFTGHDFGINNTAAIWVAQDPSTAFFYIYRTYHGSSSVLSHAENFKDISKNETIIRKVGGNHQEQEIRDGYGLAGWHISEPNTRGVDPQIDRVRSLNTQNKIYVFSDLSDYLDEKLTMSWELDDEERLTPKIHDEASYHLMACERYLMSEFRPDAAEGGNKIFTQSW